MKRYEQKGPDGKPVPYYIYDQNDLDKAYANHQAWQKDHSKGKQMNLWHTTCKGLDFSGKDLTGASLAHANLPENNFDGAVLKDVDFSRSNLNGSTIRNTAIEHANLYCSKLPNVTLENVKISGTNLSGVDMSAAKWVHGVTVTGGKANQLKMTEKQSKGIKFDASVEKVPTTFVAPDFKEARESVKKGMTKGKKGPEK